MENMKARGDAVRDSTALRDLIEHEKAVDNVLRFAGRPDATDRLTHAIAVMREVRDGLSYDSAFRRVNKKGIYGSFEAELAA